MQFSHLNVNIAAVWQALADTIEYRKIALSRYFEGCRLFHANCSFICFPAKSRSSPVESLGWGWFSLCSAHPSNRCPRYKVHAIAANSVFHSWLQALVLQLPGTGFSELCGISVFPVLHLLPRRSHPTSHDSSTSLHLRLLHGRRSLRFHREYSLSIFHRIVWKRIDGCRLISVWDYTFDG